MSARLIRRLALAHTAAALLALLLVAGCASVSATSLAPTPARALWIGGAVADVETSQSAFGRGASEANPVFDICASEPPGRPCMYGLKAAMYGGLSLAEGWLRRQNGGHLPAWVEWVIWGTGAVVQGLIAYHNSGVAR